MTPKNETPATDNGGSIKPNTDRRAQPHYSTLDTARGYLAAGLSVFPIGTNKKPGGPLPKNEDGSASWKPFQERLPTDAELVEWFKNGQQGIGIVGGAVSGNLTILDFDAPGAFDEWMGYVQDHGAEDLALSLPRVRTPNGTEHAYLRCTEAAGGNEKLATLATPIQRPDGHDSTTKIETRAEGGYVVAPGSPGSCHPTGRTYVLEHGNLTAIPILTPDERELLMACARMCDEAPEAAEEPRAARQAADAGRRPGDDYGDRGDIPALLEKHGWRRIKGGNGTEEYWQRPGKKGKEHSATFGYKGTRAFVVFTSSAPPFKPSVTYNPFHVYALLEHGGDHSAAAAALRREGYGVKDGEAPMFGSGMRPSHQAVIDADRKARAAAKNAEGEDLAVAPAIREQLSGPEPRDTWPYTIDDGRLVLLSRKSEGEPPTRSPICDFTARITEEIRTDGGTVFRLEVLTPDGRRNTLEIGAERFADDRALKAALTAAAGALHPVRTRMSGHLGTAIQLLSRDIRPVRRYACTGWEGGRFLLPGREGQDVHVELPRKLPYSQPADADLVQGLEGLAALLAAPVALPLGLRSERHAIVLAGPTGSLKSSTAQTAMTIYGSGFANDDLLVKWGEGATRGAIARLATHAGDLPFLIDNYKPNTGAGPRDFVALMHHLLEGGEKDRLNRAAELRESREIHAWPVITGEDVPTDDAAALARVLVIPFTRPDGWNEPLARAQALTEHLPAVGRAWLDWLESDAGAEVCQGAGKALADRRREWITYLRNNGSGMANPLRVATNLAINELVFRVALECPDLQKALTPYASRHVIGLKEVANSMATYTTVASEGQRFLDAIRSLLASGRCTLIDLETIPRSYGNVTVIGWNDGAGGAYIDPNIARSEVRRFMPGALPDGLSAKALYDQLEAMDALETTDRGKKTKKVRVDKGRGPISTLHLKASALEEAEEDDGHAA